MFYNTPDFVINADNVYRTKHYIVKQQIKLTTDACDNNNIVSYDTFYLRNKNRDKQYETIFADKVRINGKRLISTMSTRKYIK